MDQYFDAMEDLLHRVLVRVKRAQYQDFQVMALSNEKGVLFGCSYNVVWMLKSAAASCSSLSHAGCRELNLHDPFHKFGAHASKDMFVH